ncbi:unnamed protein product [Notodromas monacha]|uniref:Nicastrin n=1 Tax=Notodromas monacha TaxID=399045 RepID=A0A7R9C258_9CRUS|nr:unnamed protein product [Notodromas monacha]CAG0924771.1 unnamed protein product [Notodromas monacha]
MAIAESLSSIRTELEKLNEFVHLMLFNGESTEYIGSSKMVYDMENNAFPSVASTDPSMNAMALMKINHIGRWIELDQVGTGDPKKLFVHFEPTSQSDASVNQKTSELKTKLKDAATGSGLVVEEASSGTSGLPPSSLHTFLKKNKKIAGVVLSGYNDRFVNQYYHSFKETPEATLNYSCGTDTVHEDLLNRLETVSTIVAKGLANLLGVAPPASPNRDKMAAMLDCYLCDSNCSLFYNISSQRYRPRLMPGVPFPLYTSVGNLAGFVYDVVNFTRRLLVSILGSEVPNVSQKECKQSENDVVMTGIRTIIPPGLRVTPAFQRQEYSSFHRLSKK